jgi:hypothetical protein
MARISGERVKERILARMTIPSRRSKKADSADLGSPDAQRVLALIATRQPRSIHELGRLAGQMEGGLGRILSTLARLRLVTMEDDGRATVPTLTSLGQKTFEGLGLSSVGSGELAQGLSKPGTLEVSLPSAPPNDLQDEKADGELVVRLWDQATRGTVELRRETELVAFSTRLLDNWWRILCRRDYPFELLEVDMASTSSEGRAILRARALGGLIELAVETAHTRARRLLAEDRFTQDVLNGVLRPTVLRLHVGRLFNRPVEAKLRRLEDVLQHPNEMEFCRTAGALGLSPHELDSSTADKIRSFIEFAADEDARLDLASSISGELLEPTLNWIEREIDERSSTNSLPALPELHQAVRATSLLDTKVAYRIGYASARAARAIWKMAEDRSVGGPSGLSHLCGGTRTFTASPSSHGIVRGFQAHGESNPVVVVRDEGALSNLFLIARAIGDYVWFGSREAPVADLYTSRQALGRAFAAEFLAPAAAVMHMVEEEGKQFDEVAAHFGVNIAVAQHQYGNAREDAPLH